MKSCLIVCIGCLAMVGCEASQPEPPLEASTSSHDFGAVDVHADPQEVMVTFSSDRAESLDVEVTVTGLGFSLVSSDCVENLANEEDCVVQAAFDPALVGLLHGQIQVAADGYAPFQIPLQGSGAALIRPFIQAEGKLTGDIDCTSIIPGFDGHECDPVVVTDPNFSVTAVETVDPFQEWFGPPCESMEGETCAFNINEYVPYISGTDTDISVAASFFDP